MAESLDKQFEDIIQDAISKGSKIDCGLEEYIDQMGSWQHSIQTCIDAAQDDIRRRDKAQEAEDG